MTYIALLRGINVGGNNRVEMARLKTVFEQLGFEQVRTYINSGNVLFDVLKEQDQQKLASMVEKAVEIEFGFRVPVVVRDTTSLIALEKTIPSKWVNNAVMKTDVMFLWDTHDKKEILHDLKIKPELEDVVYRSGAIIWRVDRENITKSGMLKIIGTDLYKHMTIRNVNTLRKLVDMFR